MAMNTAHPQSTHVLANAVYSSGTAGHSVSPSNIDPQYLHPSCEHTHRRYVITNKRFASVLPIAAVFVSRPALTLGLGILAAFVAAVVSPHYGLSVAIAAVTLFYVCIDRRFLESLLMNPQVVLGYGTVMSSAVGVAYVVWASGGMFDYGLCAQQAAMLYLLITGGLILHVVLRKVPAVVIPELSASLRDNFLRPVGLVGVFLALIELTRIVIGLRSGALDYGEYGAEAQTSFWGLHTYFSFLPRLTGTCFFLLPATWRAGNPVMRLFVLAIGTLVLILGLVSGSRTLVILPMLNLTAGIYFFLPLKSRTFGYAILAAPFVLAPIAYAMALYRNTDEYRSTESYRVTDRVRIFADTIRRRGNNEAGDLEAVRFHAYNFGKHMIGVTDSLIYDMTPAVHRHAGWENIDRTLWVWVPKFFVRSKPYMQDGNDIVVDYTGVRNARTANTISLPADLYRRFSWFGVFLGAPLSMLLVALYWRTTLRTLLYTNATTGILLLQIALSMLTLGTGSTLLSTLNEWLYAIPKHVVTGLLLYSLARLAVGASGYRGLASYTSLTEPSGARLDQCAT